tara:strand:+ start:475 stop:1002 length:528 start_codon:yes stop_codon:yes gene_type:complete
MKGQASHEKSRLKKNNFFLFTQFWLYPILIGALIALGYNGTKRKFSINNKDAKEKINLSNNTSEVIKTNSQSKTSENSIQTKTYTESRVEINKESEEIQQKEKININTSDKEYKQDISKIKNITNENIEGDSKTIKIISSKNETFSPHVRNETIKSKADEYFKKYTFDELLKTLP